MPIDSDVTATGIALAGTLSAVNSDGTINPVIDSGVTITGVADDGTA